ncbi:MAG: succinate dehydrogenase, hydrophobic membrane anchor protein [Gammaproteobacteria bacterium]|nr:succinate dehydrogenase, hydrophobic membrane anchor protein [Gammaproteobacteria bacterium]
MNSRGDGIRSWLIQRISAIFIVLYLIYLFISISSFAQMDFSTWHGWVALTTNKILLVLFFLSLLLHAWVGIRDVVLDYVHGFTIRFVALTVIIGSMLAMAIWLLLIIIKV